MTDVTEGLGSGRVSANGIDFAYLEAATGPLALCLHGFPDTAWGWRHLLPALADAGFHAGRAVHARLRADLAAPDGQLPGGRAGGRRQRAARRARRRRRRGAHRPRLGRHGDLRCRRARARALAPGRDRRGPPAQRPRRRRCSPTTSSGGPGTSSSSRTRWPTWRWAWTTSSSSPGCGRTGRRATTRPSTSTTSATRSASPSNLAAAIGYYRAMLQPDLQRPELRPPSRRRAAHPRRSRRSTCTAPTTGACRSSGPARPERSCRRTGSRVEIVADAGHFLQLEQPEVVNRLIVEHLRS